MLTDLMAAIAAGDDDRAEQASLAAARLGDAVLPTLQALILAEDRDRRWWAVRTLGALGTEKAVGILIAALEDADADVRACATVALANLCPVQAVGPLVDRLSDPSAYVARLAADGLVRFEQAAVEPLIVALQQGDVATRVGAARALFGIQPREAVPALCAALDDPSAAVAHYAERALEEMGVGLVLFRP